MLGHTVLVTSLPRRVVGEGGAMLSHPENEEADAERQHGGRVMCPFELTLAEPLERLSKSIEIESLAHGAFAHENMTGNTLHLLIRETLLRAY